MKHANKKTTSGRLIQSYLSSVISISLVLLLIGVVGILGVNASSVSRYFKENLKLSIIFNPACKESEALKCKEKLDKKRYVQHSEYISVEQGEKEMAKILGDDFLKAFDLNPIPISIDFSVKSEFVHIDSLKIIKRELEQLDNVREIVYQESLVESIVRNIEKIGVILLVLIVLLLFISVVLINNTVRLNVQSRRFTIYTMKMVGAKRSFIRKPFLRGAVYQGGVSGIVAIGLLFCIVHFIKRDFNTLYTIFDEKLMVLIGIGVLLFGIAICYICTYFIVNKLLSSSIDKLHY